MSGGVAYAAMSTCDKCGRQFPTAPAGVIHKCVCPGGMMVPDATPVQVTLVSPTPPSRDADVERVDAPENGETRPDWAGIKRAIDYFVGRVPTIGKHRAINNAHIRTVVERLDAAGDREAADTIVWQCWYRALDAERERFLLSDKDEQLSEAAARIEALEAENRKLREALAPFAKAGSIAGERSPYGDWYAYRPAAGDEYAIYGDHLRTAHAAYNSEPPHAD